MPATSVITEDNPAAVNYQNASSHYEQVSENYEAAFFYSSEHYRNFVLKHILQHFGLPLAKTAASSAAPAEDTTTSAAACCVELEEGLPQQQVVHQNDQVPHQQLLNQQQQQQQQQQQILIADIGAGTGNFTQALAEAAAVTNKVLCVEPSAEMLAKAACHPNVQPLLMDAIKFSQLPPSEMQYSHALLKEVIHHIPADELSCVFQGMASQLLPGGVVVVVTRPQHVDYPMFKRAKEIWAQQQPHPSSCTAAMEAAGLEASVAAADYTTTLSLATWLGMMRARFWSTFSLCTDEELEQGVAEVAEQYAGQEEVQFVDRLLLVVGRKPRPS